MQEYYRITKYILYYSSAQTHFSVIYKLKTKPNPYFQNFYNPGLMLVG